MAPLQCEMLIWKWHRDAKQWTNMAIPRAFIGCSRQVGKSTTPIPDSRGHKYECWMMFHLVLGTLTLRVHTVQQVFNERESTRNTIMTSSGKGKKKDQKKKLVMKDYDVP